MEAEKTLDIGEFIKDLPILPQIKRHIALGQRLINAGITENSEGKKIRANKEYVVERELAHHLYHFSKIDLMIRYVPKEKVATFFSDYKKAVKAEYNLQISKA